MNLLSKNAKRFAQLILAIDVRPCLSVMCYQVPTRQLQLPSQNQHTKMAKVLCGDRRKGKMAREEEYKSKLLCFAPSLTLSPEFHILNQDLTFLK